MPTSTVARHIFGPRRHEMPETQVVIKALLRSDTRFVETHDQHWTVIDAPSLCRSMDEVRFVVVDLETTGSVIGVDEIVEIGLTVVQNGVITDEFESLVWTDRAIPPWVARLTGIRNDDLVGAPTFTDISGTLIDLMADNVFVAHDIRFDLPFLRWELARRGLPRPDVIGLCTLQLSRNLWPDLPSRSLPDLATRFGIIHTNPHRAADDATAAAGVLLKALETARALGAMELGDLFLADANQATDLTAQAAES